MTPDVYPPRRTIPYTALVCCGRGALRVSKHDVKAMMKALHIRTHGAWHGCGSPTLAIQNLTNIVACCLPKTLYTTSIEYSVYDPERVRPVALSLECGDERTESGRERLDCPANGGNAALCSLYTETDRRPGYNSGYKR